MKLLFCKKCQDIFKLSHEARHCACGEVGGRYLDHLQAEYWGDPAVPMGISNFSLREALSELQESGLGPEVTAFLITASCKTYEKRR